MKYVIRQAFDAIEPKLTGGEVRFADGVHRWQVQLDADGEQFVYASAEEMRALAERLWDLAIEAESVK